jgi:23S rRNA G2069 N7-methylase RlmK/C1962 C5-methylase RlmI
MKFKPVLDPCCGSRMFWFNKSNPNVVFADIRCEDLDLNYQNRTCHIRPDKLHDFRKMDFPDNTFYHVVFDPPHLIGAGKSGYMAKKYGSLTKDWQSDIRSGFDECMRVLRPNGTLIFKWNESSVKVSELIKVIGQEPLYGHRTLQTSKTIWMAFLKLGSPQSTTEGDE